MMAAGRSWAGYRSASQHKSVRIGMLPLLTLIAGLALFVLAVLALSTAYASITISARQADSVCAGYAVDSAGQHFVGEVDAALSDAALRGVTGANEGASAVSAQLESITATVQESHSGISIEAAVEGAQITAVISGDLGRHLEVTMEVTDELDYRIVSWKLTTVQADEGPADTLWIGEASDGSDDSGT